MGAFLPELATCLLFCVFVLRSSNARADSRDIAPLLDFLLVLLLKEFKCCCRLGGKSAFECTFSLIFILFVS